MYSLAPAFLLAGSVVLWRGNQVALAELEGVVSTEAIAQARFTANGAAVAVAVLLGLIFALGQFGTCQPGRWMCRCSPGCCFI